MWFECPTCGKTLKAPSEAAGKRAKCVGCGTTVAVPTPPADGEPVLFYPASMVRVIEPGPNAPAPQHTRPAPEPPPLAQAQPHTRPAPEGLKVTVEPDPPPLPPAPPPAAPSNLPPVDPDAALPFLTLADDANDESEADDLQFVVEPEHEPDGSEIVVTPEPDGSEIVVEPEPELIVVGRPAGHEKALEELRSAYADFSRSSTRVNGTCGCLALLAIAGGIGLWVAYGWLLGIGSIVVTIGTLVAISILLFRPAKWRARTAVGAVEAEHGLTHDQSADLLASDHETSVGSDFTEFSATVWEGDALERVREKVAARKAQPVKFDVGEGVGGIVEPSTKHALECGGCGAAVSSPTAGTTVQCPTCQAQLHIPLSPPCPKCQSLDTEYSVSTAGGTGGAIVGGALFGILGAMAGSALTSKTTAYRCTSCNHKWGVKLPVVEPQ